MIVILSILILILVVCLVLSVYRNIQLMNSIDEITNQIEESLDLLDTIYGRLYDKSKIEVYSDDYIIREIVGDIKLARDTVLLVATKLVSFSEDEETPESIK